MKPQYNFKEREEKRMDYSGGSIKAPEKKTNYTPYVIAGVIVAFALALFIFV